MCEIGKNLEVALKISIRNLMSGARLSAAERALYDGGGRCFSADFLNNHPNFHGDVQCTACKEQKLLNEIQMLGEPGEEEK